MPTFPQPGVELSTFASLIYGKAEYERPGIITEFENGWREMRARGESGRYSLLNVSCKVISADMLTIFNFLKAQDLFVQPFTLVHPDYGSVTVNYANTKLPLEKMIGGTPASLSWFAFEVPLIGQFA